MTADLLYLIELGVSLEELARRTGRTVTAIKYELDEYEKEQDKDYGVR